MCICILLFTYASARIYIYTFICIYIYIHIYIYIYIYTHIHIQIYIYIYTFIYKYVYIYIYIHIHLYIYIMWYSPKCPPLLFHIWRFGIAWWCLPCVIFSSPSVRRRIKHGTRASNTRAFFWGAEVHNSIQSPCFLAL